MVVDVRFLVRAVASAHTLSRVLNPFAQRELTPSLVSAWTIDGRMEIMVEQRAIARQEAMIIAQTLRATVLVESVDCMVPKGPRADPAPERH